MRKQTLIVAVILLLFITFVTIPVLAQDYRYTGTGFRYIGDVFHEKEVDFTGGSTQFFITGRGVVSGSQDVHVVEGPGTKINVFNNFRGETALDAPEDEYMRILTATNLTNISRNTTLYTGIEMDPGESGYIEQSATSNTISGDYMKVNNSFENTGGKTARLLEVEGFVDDRMAVEGYARVWESTEVRQSGATASGWWSTGP